MAYLGTIGKRFQDSGLEDILIEADIVAPGSIKGIISGHHYNRSMRANKMMYEALVQLRWKTFLVSHINSSSYNHDDYCQQEALPRRCVFKHM